MSEGGKGIHLEPGGGVTVNNPVGGPLTFKIRGDETNGALTVLETTAAPGEGPPLHVHAHEDEVIFVVDGHFRFRLEDILRDAPAGSFMYVPRGVRHTWQNIGNRPARLFVVFSPAGMEAFFERFSEHASEDTAAAAFRRLGSEAGMKVVGVPLSESHPA